MNTPQTTHALVLGKFYPPHRGHELLIRTAAATGERVTVLVLAHPIESLPFEDRVAWLSNTLADLDNVTIVGGIDPHPIDYGDPQVWDAHMTEFRHLLATVTDEPVTAVFTSEHYGDELARRFDATHVNVDPERTLAPVGGKAVRADPVAYWDLLPPATRGGIAQRVVVTGAESTGTTTVSQLITDRLRARGDAHGLTRCVHEFGRDRTITKLAELTARAALTNQPRPSMDDLDWPTEEFVTIATTQNQLEDDIAPLGGPVLVCDTDAFATGIWHERYVGHRSPAVEALARHPPLYLVTHHDGVPFVQDGIRDGEPLRSWMTDRFIEGLTDTGRRHAVLTGPLDERVDTALDAIDSLLDEGWGFADPLG